MSLSVVQQKASAHFENTTGAQALSFNAIPSPGNLIVVAIWGWNSSDWSTPSVADNQAAGGNSYAKASEGKRTGGGSGCEIFYAYNINSSGTFTVTVNPPGTGIYWSFEIYEIAGATSTDPFDKSSNNNGNSALPDTGSTPTLSQANEFVISVIAHNDCGSSIDVESVSPSWNRGSFSYDAVNDEPGEIDSRIVSSTSAQICRWTTHNGNHSWAACIATFKEAAVIPPIPVIYPKIDLVPTNDFDPTYNRIALQPMTSPTWASLQDSGITYQALQASSFIFGEEDFITDQETYTTKPIDIGSIVTGSFIVDLRTFSSSNLGFVSIQISTSTDGITYSAFQTFVAGQYTARYVKLKFLIQATDPVTKVRIISASLTVDVPDIDQSLLNQAISSLGTTINLTGFTSVKSVVMTTVGSASSLLSPQITDQSGLPSSFVVKMFDKTDTAQNGNVNIYCKGY